MVANLLLVDDEHLFCTLTQRILERCGYSVEVAADGLAAWKLIDSSPSRFDLILLDKQMPVMDGLGLLKLIKADRRFDDIPVVMLTGDNRQEDVLEGLAAGAIYYLTKPVAKELLELVIENVLDEFRQKRELRELIGQRTNYQNLLHRAEFAYRTLSEAKDLALLLADCSTCPERTLNGYLELLINAVEHGNLGISYAEKGELLKEGRWMEAVEERQRQPKYQDRTVQVVLEKSAAASVVTITDEGDGFDWHSYLEFSPERAFDLHGRGIAISKAMCFDNLEYRGSGNIVVATVSLPAVKG
jgi:CheY-like chemotaxis protein